MSGTETLFDLSMAEDESFLSLDRSENVIHTANVFDTKRIHDDSLSDSLDKKTFNFTKNFQRNETQPIVMDEPPDHRLVNNDMVELIERLESATKDLTSLQEMGQPIEDNLEDSIERLRFIFTKQARLLYDDFIVKRLDKVVVNLQNIPEDGWAHLDELKDNAAQMKVDNLEDLARGLAARKYYNVVLQVLEKFVTSVNSVDHRTLTGLLADVESSNQTLEQADRDTDQNSDAIKLAERDLLEKGRVLEAYSEEEKLLKTEMERLATISDAIIKETEEIDAIPRSQNESSLNDLDVVLRQLEGVQIDEQIYFLQGFLWYDIENSQFHVNERGNIKRNADLYFLSLNDTAGFQLKYLTHLLRMVNNKECFEEQYECLKAGFAKLSRFAKQIAFGKIRTSIGLRCRYDEMGCTLTGKVFFAHGGCAVVTWHADIVDLKLEFKGATSSLESAERMSEITTLASHNSIDVTSPNYIHSTIEKISTLPYIARHFNS